MSVETRLEVIHIFLFSVSLFRGIAHHLHKVIGVLVDVLRTLSNIVKLLHFGIHHALGNVVRIESLNKLLPRDIHRGVVGIEETIPPRRPQAGE